MNYRNAIIFLYSIFILNYSFAQVSIERNDFPVSDKKYLSSTASIVSGLELQNMGPKSTWNYSFLKMENYKEVSYIPAQDLPMEFRFIFRGSNLILENNDYSVPDIFPLKDILNFYKLNSSGFFQLGIGMTIQDQPVPLRYSSEDRIFKFPLEYGSQGSSSFSFEFPIPDLTFVRNQDRTYRVDGWGKLITPSGTYEVIRVKTHLIYNDSVVIFGTPSKIPPQHEFVYQWFAKEKGIPVLEIKTRTEGGLEAPYEINFLADTTNKDTTHAKILDNPNFKLQHYAYFNRENSRVIIQVNSPERIPFDYVLYNSGGKLMESGDQLLLPGKNRITLDAQNREPGIYYFIGRMPSGVFYEKVLINP